MALLFERVEQLLAHVAEQTVTNENMRSEQSGIGSTMNDRGEHSGASGDMVWESQSVLLKDSRSQDTTTTVSIGSQHVAKQRLKDEGRGNEEEYVGDFGMDKDGLNLGDVLEVAGTLERQVEMVQEAKDIDGQGYFG